MSSPLDEICINGAKLAISWNYRLVLAAKFISCLLGIFGVSWIITSEGIRWLAHPNAKVVYVVHLFWTSYIPLAFMVPMTFDFVRLLIPQENPCDYTLPLSVSFWIRLVGAVGNITQSYTMLAFALERTIATIFPKKYEKINKSYIGWFLGFGAIFLSFTHIFTLLVLPNNKFEGENFATSILTPLNSDSYTLHLSLMMYLEITTITIFTVNLVVNRIQRRMIKIGEIAHKYQIKETSKLISALLPCFWVHFVIFLIPTLGLSIRRKMDQPFDAIQNVEWIEFLSNYQLYSIVMPAVVLFLRRKERKKTVVNSHLGMKGHFEQLSTVW